MSKSYTVPLPADLLRPVVILAEEKLREIERNTRIRGTDYESTGYPAQLRAIVEFDRRYMEDLLKQAGRST